MADTGLLSPELQQLMAQFGVSDEDRAAANKQAMMALGFGLLGGRKGQELQTISNAGQNALGYRQQMLSSIPQQRLAAMGGASKAMELTQQLKMQKDLADYQDYLRKNSGAAPPTGTPPAGPVDIPKAFAAPPLPPSVSGVMNNPGGALPELPNVSQLSQAPPPMPQQAPAAPPASDPYSQLMAQAAAADAYAKTSGNQAAAADAVKLREQALKWREKMAEPKVVMVNGKPTYQRFGEYGGQQTVQGADVPPDIQMLSLGDRTQAIDKYRVQPGQTFQQGVGPDALLSSETTRRGQNMTDARARELNALTREAANAGSVVQGDGGFYRVPKVGPAVPIQTPDGGTLQSPMPATIKEKVAQNNVTLSLTNDAIAAVKKNPEAFGPGNMVGDSITQWTDPEGVAVRAKVANLSSQKFHDRSGANITASESPRLQPFIPSSTDRPEVVIQKLQGFQREAALMNKELGGGKSVAEVTGGGANFDYSKIPKGATYTAPDGSQRVKR